MFKLLERHDYPYLKFGIEDFLYMISKIQLKIKINALE